MIPSVQQRFVAHTKSLVKEFQVVDNRFDESSDKVVIIDTSDVMTDDVARIITSAHEEGQKQLISWHIAGTLQQSNATRRLI